MVEDEVDELLPLPLLKGSPLGRLGLHVLLLGAAVGAAVVLEELDAELDGGVEDGLELWQLGGLVDEGRVGGRVLRAVLLDLVEVPGVCHHHAVLPELVQLTLVDLDLLGGLLSEVLILCLHFYPNQLYQVLIHPTTYIHPFMLFI